MQTQLAHNLKQKLDRRISQLTSAGFGSFPQRLQDFWGFLQSDPPLSQMEENLTNKFPETASKVALIMGSRQNPQDESEEEASAVAYEVLRRFSVSDSPRGVMHPACFPAEFSYINCKTQAEIDESYLKVFKDIYLERLLNYIEEQVSSDSEASLISNAPRSTVININAPTGSVQTGEKSNAYVNQKIEQDFSEIAAQLAVLRNQFQLLPTEEKSEAIEVIDAIEVEIQCENPSKGKLKSFLLATKDFALKTGTDLAASTLAKLLESQLGIKS